VRTVAGLLLFHGLILLVGSTFLVAVRMVPPRPGELARAVGLAHLTGVSTTCVVAICLLVIGGTLTAPAFVAIALGLFVVLAAIAFIRRDQSAERVEAATGARRSLGWPAILLGAAIAVFIAAGILGSKGLPTAWDAAHNWTLKTIVLLGQGDLSSGAFRDAGLFAGAHQDYPILQPVLGSLALRFTARSDQALLVAELWFLVAAFVAAAVFLLRGRAASLVLVLAPLGIAVAAGPIQGVVRGDADVAMSAFLSIAVLCLGLWMERPRPGLLPVAAALLAAAANTKNEGMVFAIGVAVVALAVGLVRPPRGFRPLALTAVAVAASAAPWRLWVADHGPFPSDVRSLGDALSPSLLADSLHQLDYAAQDILARLADGSGAGWLFPAFVATAVLMIVAGSDRRMLALYLGAAFVMIASLLWIYWTSPQPDVEAHIDRTTLRTVTAPMFVSAVALAHMLGRLFPAPTEPATVALPASTERSERGRDM
jgi:hypothetical protein